MIDAKLGPIQSQIGPRPWTEQPQGCGEPGFGIHVPSRFLDLERPSPLYKDSWELRTKGKLLLLFLVYSLVLFIGFSQGVLTQQSGICISKKNLSKQI